MSNKKGRSEEKTDWFGDKYVQHYDEHGVEVGRSEDKTDWFGDKYVQHYGEQDDEIGRSEDKTDWFGDEYTQHFDESDNKSGISEEKTDWFGDQFTQHLDQSGNETGRSEAKTDWLGDGYIQHWGSSPGDTSSRRVSPRNSTAAPARASEHSETSGSTSTRVESSSPNRMIDVVDSVFDVIGSVLKIGFVVLFGLACLVALDRRKKAELVNETVSSAQEPVSLGDHDRQPGHALGQAGNARRHGTPVGAGVQIDEAHLVTQSSIGPVQRGMSLMDAKGVMPHATFERTTDGDGVPLVAVRSGENELFILYAGEEDPESEIAWSAKIRNIATFNAAYLTADGIHPGAAIADVERILGSVTSISQSEIESREYITFERQPPGLSFRLNYTGIFPDNSRETTKFQASAEIYAIEAYWP